jgi:prevent-host-death family protein
MYKSHTSALFSPKIAKLTILAYRNLMTMTATQAKDQLANLLERARTAGERIVIEKHGKPVAVLVSIEDWKRLLPERYFVSTIHLNLPRAMIGLQISDRSGHAHSDLVGESV